MCRAFFTSGGSDSVESALRIARQYWKVRGRAERFKFISLHRGYHGTHFGGASVNGNPNFRRAYEPMLAGCSQVPAPFLYRNPFNETDPDRLADLCLAALEDDIRFQGPETVAAFIAEPVLGAGGVIVPPASYWPKLRALLDRHEILLIADEVVSGFGRTGSWFGARGFGVKPDLMCFAKGITSGYLPFGAVTVNRRVEQAFKDNDDMIATIFHGYTYSGHPVGCAAALAALDETFARDLTSNAAKEGRFLLDGFEALKQEFETIGDVRGKGLMLGMEVVADRATKAAAGPKYLARIADLAYAAGVNIRTQQNVFIFSPPLILQRPESEQILAALQVAFARNELAPAN
jgi:adenosylmethionine-8-amino-7-oxononanoate aminotransferase